MSTPRVWYILAVGSLAVLAVYMVATYGRLPDRIPTHFDVHGEPNDWSNKTGFFLGFGGVTAGVTVIWGLIALMIHCRVGEKLISLPWKDYWLATPERKETMWRKLHVGMAATWLLTNVTLLLGYHAIVQSSLKGVWPHLPMGPTVWVMIAVWTVVMVWLLLTFRPPRSGGDEWQEALDGKAGSGHDDA